MNANEYTYRARAQAAQIKPPVLIALLVLVIVVSVLSLFCTMREPAQQANLTAYTALGTVAAEETARLLEDRGKIVVVALDIGQRGAMIMNAQLDSFREALRDHRDIAVMATEMIEHDALELTDPGMAVPADEFFEVLGRHADADAIVWFLEPPLLTEADARRVPKQFPISIVIPNSGFGLKRLFEWGLVEVALVPRWERAPATDREPATARERFERSYQVVTPETAGSLPY